MQKKFVSNRNSAQSGQVGVIVLLLSAIVLVIGLSIANRTIKESQSTVAQEDSARVFSTAESGVQQALNNIFQFESDQNANLIDEFTFEDANLNQISIKASETFDGFLAEKNSLEIKINEGQTGVINLNWSKSTCGQGAANLLVGHYFLNAGNYDVNYYMIGNCPSYSDQNLITANSSALDSYQFQHSINITDSNNQSAFLRIFPLIRGTDINLSSTAGLVSNAQYTILSLAQMPDGSSAKAIEVKRSIPSAPAFMDFALVSGGSLEK
jgi:Tfp pilus assembly protein PilX